MTYAISVLPRPKIVHQDNWTRVQWLGTRQRLRLPRQGVPGAKPGRRRQPRQPGFSLLYAVPRTRRPRAEVPAELPPPLTTIQ